MKELILILSLLLTTNLFSQNQKILIPYLQKGGYGFADTQKTILIKAKYDKALPFYEDYDLTIAVRNSNSVIINKKGKVILKSGSDYFYRDTMSGMRLLPPLKMERIALREFCQLKSSPEFAIVNAFARRNIFDKMNGLYFVSNQNKAFLIDKNGKRKTEHYDKIKHFDYGEIEYCITEDNLNQKKGLLDENGTVVLECVYNKINYKGKGVFTIKQGSIEREFKVQTKPYSTNIPNNKSNNDYKIRRKNNKSGVVDSNGELVIQYKYDKLYPLNENKFIFWKDNMVGIFDAKENQLFSNKLPFNFSERSKNKDLVPYTVFNKNYVFFNVQKKWCLINLEGNQVGSKYDGIYIDFQNIANGITGIEINNKLGVINKKGELILKPVYDKIYCLNEDNSFVVKAQDKWIWFDFSGKIIYENFDDFGYQLKKHLLVLQNEKWFYVNNTGKVFKD